MAAFAFVRRKAEQTDTQAAAPEAPKADDLTRSDKAWLERFFAGLKPGEYAGPDGTVIESKFAAAEADRRAWGEGIWGLIIKTNSFTNDVLVGVETGVNTVSENIYTLTGEERVRGQAVMQGLAWLDTQNQEAKALLTDIRSRVTNIGTGSGGDLMPVLTDIRSAIDRILPSSGGLSGAQTASINDAIESAFARTNAYLAQILARV